LKTPTFAAWPIAALLLILSAFPFASVAHGQSPETLARVIEVLDFDRTYVARVDALIDQTADKPRIWSGPQSPEARRQRQAEVRETLLQKRADVKARLHEALSTRFIEDELREILSAVGSGGSLKDVKPELAYAVNFEFDNAIADFMLPLAAVE
jgi:hypothetical protein